MNLNAAAVAESALGPHLRQSGAEIFFRCPNHEDRHPSLQINTAKNAFICGPCNVSGNAWRLAAFLGHAEPNDKRAVSGWLRERGLLAESPTNGNGNGHHKTDEPKQEFERVAEFYYGADLRKVRLERPSVDGSKPQKSFRWEHKESDKWLPGDGGKFKPLYANRIFRESDQLGMVLGLEGEGKADLAAEMGLPAFSFKSLSLDHCDALGGLDVVLWPDADRPGFKQCQDAAHIIHESGQARRIRTIVPPPEMPIAGDIADAVRSLLWGRTQIDQLISEAKAFPPEPEPVGLLLDRVTEQKVNWLWRNRIPRGALTILDGDPGNGKSLLSLEIASRISRGAPLPGETESREPAGVVILTAEDSLSHVVVPRLRAAGADLSRIVAVPYSPSSPGEQTFSKLPGDLPVLQRAIERVKADLVIFDVLVCYIPATLSTQRDQDVRLALAPLAEMSDRLQVASLLLRHLNKNTNNPALYRGGGSIAIVGAARSGLLLGNDPNDASTRVLAVVKSNLGAPTDSLSFKIATSDGLPHIEWSGKSNHTAESLLATPGTSDERSAREEAINFLKDELANGPMEAKQVFAAAQDVGISKRTLERVKKSVADSYRVGMTGSWFWTLRGGE